MNASQVKPGVVSGDDLQALFAFAKAGKFALPAINVIGYNRNVDWDALLLRLKRITDANSRPVIE